MNQLIFSVEELFELEGESEVREVEFAILVIE